MPIKKGQTEGKWKRGAWRDWPNWFPEINRCSDWGTAMPSKNPSENSSHHLFRWCCPVFEVN